ncbi:hypothetical protein Plhal710r2_c039g0137621 [Plasmopara halstedii]
MGCDQCNDSSEESRGEPEDHEYQTYLQFDDSYDLQPSDIPDADIELLLARIVDRLFFIAPILATVSRLLKNVRILVEEDVVGKNVLLKGRFEFVLKRGTKIILLVEANREDMLRGLV